MKNKHPKYIKVNGTFYKIAYEEPVPLPAVESIQMDTEKLQQVVKDIILKVDEQLERLDDTIAAAKEAGLPSKKLYSLQKYLRTMAKEQNSVGAEYRLY